MTFIPSRDTTHETKMAEMAVFLQLVAFIFALFLPVASAFDGGDVAALLLGLTVSTLGICACLGVYARRRAGTA